MKEWIVIHQIKSLYNQGNGLSKRQIAKELKISRNTVSKYLNLPDDEITSSLSDTDRTKKLDDWRDYVIHLLQAYPKLSAVKVLRKLRAKDEGLDVSERSVRRYIKELKKTVSFKQTRYYEPILDMVPGVQCQVDGGELRGVLINGVATTVYLMVFVLSYSRLMHVSVSDRPINTDMLIQQHDAAFRYFGGRPEECVYDQTKLVVISEVFRELQVNQRFAQYATTAGFHIRACEGYDPESKGKVEAGVKYAKYNWLYGDSFSSWSDLKLHLTDWLDNIANQRIHGSTGRKPRDHYEHEETVHMLPYLTPACVTDDTLTSRQVDKTGLVSWSSNKYSVPMTYQCSRVGVQEENALLLIYDLNDGQIIAEHKLCLDKGQVIKNTDHYRDKALRVERLEADIQAILESVSHSQGLCALLKATSPKIYKDQLAGAKQVLTAHCQRCGSVDLSLLDRLLDSPRLTATGLRDRLEAWHNASDKRTCYSQPPASHNDKQLLSCYGALNDRPNGQGESHVVH